MRTSRIALGVAGVLLLTFGVFRLVTELDTGDLLVLGLWLVAAVALHDGLIAPITVGTGVALTKVPPRARRYLQGALIVGALITVIAIPLIGRQGTQPASKAILLRDYATNLALLLGMTAAIALVLYALRVLREHGPAERARRRGSSLTSPATCGIAPPKATGGATQHTACLRMLHRSHDRMMNRWLIPGSCRA